MNIAVIFKIPLLFNLPAILVNAIDESSRICQQTKQKKTELSTNLGSAIEYLPPICQKTFSILCHLGSLLVSRKVASLHFSLVPSSLSLISLKLYPIYAASVFIEFLSSEDWEKNFKSKIS
uniref:Uncharacterized protein n=1 Tax=Cacopsylla melanoneura TaxID=428564 RepID=A0A8D8ZUF0_9HEMI